MSASVADTGINLYTKQMLPYFDQTKMGPTPTGFQALYGRAAGKTVFSPDTDEIDIDIRKGYKRSAKLIRRHGNVERLLGPNQVNVGVGNSTSIARVFPLSVEEADLQASRQTKRIPGESPVNSGVTAQMRLRYWAAEEHFELYMRQVILMERLASQSILEGKQDAILGTTDPALQYSMYRNPDNSITLGTQWTVHATANPITDLDAAINIAIENGDRAPTFALMGSSAVANMTQCSVMLETADNRRYEMIRAGQNVNPPSEYNVLLQNGWTAWGYVRTYEGHVLWIFTQGFTWQDDENSDAHVKFMPVGKVVLGSLDARNDRYFGPGETFKDDSEKLRFYQEWFGFNIKAIPSQGTISQKSAILDPRMFMLDAYKNTQNTKITLRCQTAPLFATIETDTWVVIENAA